MASFWRPRKPSLLPVTVQERLRHERRKNLTYPLANSSRKRNRRWPLVLRFIQGSIHLDILFPVVAHSLFAAMVVYINEHITQDYNLPGSIIPSLSIVVGLMLVFRNQTAYSRFWNGRLHLNTITSAIRCLSRQILVLVPAPNMTPLTPGESTPRLLGPQKPIYKTSNSFRKSNEALSGADYERTMETVKILIAMLYTVKNHLRADWGVALSPGTSLTDDGQEADMEEYSDLLPVGLKGFEHKGLGLTLQLATFVESFIHYGADKNWFRNGASSNMIMELNYFTKAYGDMEVIRLVPIPVSHLIHQKQALALYLCILPFSMASEMSWWAIPLVAFVSFTLYGIEAIAVLLEDPFGFDKIDINLEALVQDTRQEVEVLITAWQSQGDVGGLFRPGGWFGGGGFNGGGFSGLKIGERYTRERSSEETRESGRYSDNITAAGNDLGIPVVVSDFDAGGSGDGGGSDDGKEKNMSQREPLISVKSVLLSPPASIAASSSNSSWEAYSSALEEQDSVERNDYFGRISTNSSSNKGGFIHGVGFKPWNRLQEIQREHVEKAKRDLRRKRPVMTPNTAKVLESLIDPLEPAVPAAVGGFGFGYNDEGGGMSPDGRRIAWAEVVRTDEGKVFGMSGAKKANGSDDYRDNGDMGSRDRVTGSIVGMVGDEGVRKLS